MTFFSVLKAQPPENSHDVAMNKEVWYKGDSTGAEGEWVNLLTDGDLETCVTTVEEDAANVIVNLGQEHFIVGVRMAVGEYIKLYNLGRYRLFK